MKRAFSLLLPCISLLCVAPALADQTIGLPPDSNTGSCIPFGCAYNGEYQQVYTARAFSGPITINDLEFFNTSFNSGASSMNGGFWTISLSTTSADWNTLSGNFSSNIGPDNTVVFSGDLVQPWGFGDTLHINLTTPFTYTPGPGANLLLDVMALGTTASGGFIYFDTNGDNRGGLNGNRIMGRVYCPGGACGSGTTNSGFGLVTNFSSAAPTVPEPSNLFLLSTGLLGVAQFVRRKIAS
jgi:hypothetical protein